jgi:cytochrome P450
MSVCPIAHGFNPLSPTYFSDPYPEFARLREEGPVLYLADIDHYVVTRYDDIVAILRDRDNFSAANVQAPMIKYVEEASEILKNGFPREPTFANADPPRHTKIRTAAMKCLNSRRFKKHEPEIRQCAEKLVDELRTTQVCNLTEALAFPLAGFAAGRLIGFPLEDLHQIEEWSEIWPVMTFGLVPPDQQVAGAKAMVSFWNYAEQFVDLRASTPDDDFTSDLLALSNVNPDALTRRDVVNMVFSMMLAGHDTTTMAITNGMFQILSHRDQWQALCADSSLIAGAVDELFRFDPPTVLRRRLAKREVAVGEVTLPAGAQVMLLLGAANRDPAQFDNADDIDVGRRNAKDHLAFGVAWHYCLGAPLARFEMSTVLELLTQLTPGMQIAPQQKLDYRPSGTQHALKGLMVEPKGRSSAAA